MRSWEYKLAKFLRQRRRGAQFPQPLAERGGIVKPLVQVQQRGLLRYFEDWPRSLQVLFEVQSTAERSVLGYDHPLRVRGAVDVGVSRRSNLVKRKRADV